MFYKIVRFVANIIMRLFFRIRYFGIENIPDEGNVILCSNHMTNWDPIFISMVVNRQIHWMAKKELFKNKFLAFLINKLGAFPVDRHESDITAVKNALRVLKKDKVLGIFPEGTRVKNMDLSNVKPGVALLSIKSKSPVIPIYIEVNSGFFSKVNIFVGEAMNFHSSYNTKLSIEDYTHISKQILESIYELKSQLEEVK